MSADNFARQEAIEKVEYYDYMADQEDKYFKTYCQEPEPEDDEEYFGFWESLKEQDRKLGYDEDFDEFKDFFLEFCEKFDKKAQLSGGA